MELLVNIQSKDTNICVTTIQHHLEKKKKDYEVKDDQFVENLIKDSDSSIKFMQTKFKQTRRSIL